MTKLFIENMSKEQLTEVFEANQELQNKVYEDMVDSELLWVGDQLDYIRSYLSDWSIGPDNRNYINVSDSDGFINGLIEMDNGIPLFSDKEKVIIYDTKKLYDTFYNMEEPYEGDFEDEEGDFDEEAYDKAWEDYNNSEKALDEAVDKLADAVVDKYTEIFDHMYNDDVQLDYFLDFYYDARMEPETFYIETENDSFELFECVAYTKSYK